MSLIDRVDDDDDIEIAMKSIIYYKCNFNSPDHSCTEINITNEISYFNEQQLSTNHTRR